jgi:hypothetical protein
MCANRPAESSQFHYADRFAHSVALHGAEDPLRHQRSVLTRPR